jgi:hypothetical protein
VQSQFLGKSGGNSLAGEFYVDGYTNAFQGSNLTDEHIKVYGLRPGSNEVLRYYDVNVNAGGPFKRDKAWWHFSWRKQFNSVEQPVFNFDSEFETWNTNPSFKATYQINQNHKLIGYYQWNMKVQPTRIAAGLGSYIHDSIGPTTRQESPSWVWKGEWNGTLSNRLYIEARFGDFGYYDSRYANSDEDYFWRDRGELIVRGASGQTQNDRDRKQLTGAATYFIDTKFGSHTLRFGGEVYLESQWGGRETNVGGNIEHVYNNGRSDVVTFGIPTAIAVTGLKANDNGYLLVVNKLDQQDLFVNDTWNLGRVTLNLGARWDRYRGWMPEQRQIAYSIGPLNVPEQVFPQRTFYTWNSIGPRAGITYDLSGDGKTVLKASYGLFWHNPGPGVSADANPNQTNKSATYTWNDINGDRRWQPGEEGTLQSLTLAGSIELDPNIAQPYSHEATFYLERQLSNAIGARVGFVYKSEDDLIGQFNPYRPVSAYTVPFTFIDIGPDGRANTGDERTLTLFGVPAQDANTRFPLTNVVMNTGSYGRYRTVEAQMVKRAGNRWSAQIGGSHTWSDQYTAPNNPNVIPEANTTRWDFKVSGTYEAPYGIRISPLLRHQAGANFARTISVGSSAAAAVGAIFSGTIQAEPANARRQDNITVFDVRIEKGVTLARNIRVRGFLDLFNLLNSNAAETRTVSTGASFLRPTAILAPRTARLGVRVSF